MLIRNLYKTLLERRPAIGHEIIQNFLRPLWINQVPRLEHLTFVRYHLIDCYRVELAVVGAIVVNIADIFILIGQLAQPRATLQLFTSVGVDPDISICDIAVYIGPVNFPVLYFTCRCRQTAIAVVNTAFSALIAFSHNISCQQLSIFDSVVDRRKYIISISTF